jgi:nitrogen fixation protein FixH
VNAWAKLSLWALVALVLAVIGATVFVGSKVREETVVARPYEEGLHHDAERASRAALGLTVALADEAPRAGARPLSLRLADRQGRPVERAQVTVELSRPDTSRGEVRAEAREVAPGRYEADVAFPAPGPWDVRFDVTRGRDRVRLERRLDATAACDLGQGPCTAPLEGGGEVTLEISPRPIRTMQELTVRVSERGPESRPRPEEVMRSEAFPIEVSVSFSMPGMEMGTNRVVLGPGALDPKTGRVHDPDVHGKAVLVRCPSGRREWVAEVSVVARKPGGPDIRTARFPFTVAE